MELQEQKERKYQDEVLTLFQNELAYGFLGNLSYPKGKQQNQFGKENRPILCDELRKFLTEQKNADYQPRYTSRQIEEAVSTAVKAAQLPASQAAELSRTNSEFYELLVGGTKARPSPEKSEEDISYFDFHCAEHNHFLIAEEVSYTDQLTGKNARPDLVVYVNGIALAVIELKRSIVSLEEGIRQHLSNQIDLIPSFFTTTQFTVAASDENGFEYATILTPRKFWCKHKEDHQSPDKTLTDKESFRLFFSKNHFLRMFRYGVLTDGGVKKVMRPHQYYALCAAIPRLNNKASGVIWHSQGSGKSLTMFWLASYIKSNFEDPRVLVITDRTELDAQIALNFQRSGFVSHQASSQMDLLKTLKSGEEWLICSLIHKFGHHRTADGKNVVGDDEAKIPLDRYLKELRETIEQHFGRDFKAKGKKIFVFVDECHRTQGGKLHEAMKAIMGQDVMLIGFTGTPLLAKDKAQGYRDFKDTTKVKFGEYIHTYLHKEAVADKVILDLQYECRDVEQSISDKDKLDEKKEQITKELAEERAHLIEDRWATLEKVYSSKDRIERICNSVLDDMEQFPLSEDWCNAMLVAGTIESACKYYDYFQNRSSNTLLKGRCAIVTSFEPSNDDLRKAIDDPHLEPEKKFKHDVISKAFADAGKKDAAQYEAWAKGLFNQCPGQMKLLIVVDKLLTGFDAPSATCLYIDKEMKDHNLFQAICRVNRLGTDIKMPDGSIIPTLKSWGKIVDFKQLFKDITDAVTRFNDPNGALGGYTPDDIDGLLVDYIDKSKRDFITAVEAYDALEAKWQAMGLKTKEQVQDYYKPDDRKEERRVLYRIIGKLIATYAALADHILRARFTENEAAQCHYKVSSAGQLMERIKQISGDAFDPTAYDPQMRNLLDRFIRAEEAETVVPATADFSFLDLIDSETNEADAAEKTRQAARGEKGAAEIIEGKARSVINSWSEKDPAMYEKFSLRLEKLLEELRSSSASYTERMKELIKLIKESKHGGIAYPKGIDTPRKQALWNNRDQWCVCEEQAVYQINEVERILEYKAKYGWTNPESNKAILVIRMLAKAINQDYGSPHVHQLYIIAARNTKED